MFGKDTQIKIWSGIYIPVQDIELGYVLVGDNYILSDFESREVIETYSATEKLYRFTLWSGFTINLSESHFLCLKDRFNMNIDFPVSKYIWLDQALKNRFAMYREKSDFVDYIVDVEELGEQTCYGFKLDGDHRFLNQDYLVLHD